MHRNSTWIKIQQMQQYADICSLQNCKSSFAVNKYLHTVASVGFLFTSILILSSHIFVDPTCSSFTDFPTRTQYVFLSHALHVPCPSYPPLLHTFNGKTRGLYIISSSLCSFLQPPVTPSLIRLSILILTYLRSCASFSVNDQVSNTYKRTQRSTILFENLVVPRLVPILPVF